MNTNQNYEEGEQEKALNKILVNMQYAYTCYMHLQQYAYMTLHTLHSTCRTWQNMAYCH